MRSKIIPQQEKNFKDGKRDSSGFTWTNVTNGEFSAELSAERYVHLGGKSTHYYSEVTKKTHIAIHCTVGVLPGDIATLGAKNKVSTHFVVARDGTIYQLFNTQHWAYHLGLRSSGGNGVYSKRSIAIELSNIGPLKRVGDTMVDVYNVPYCVVSESDLYIESSYRGYTHFASYTKEQESSLRDLVAVLVRKHNIPLSMPSSPLTFSSLAPSTGVFFHQNTRSDKIDPGPALDYKKII